MPVRTPDLMPNDLLISFDPGETTGYVIARFIEGRDFAIIKRDQITWNETNQTLNHLFITNKFDFVIYERFLLYPEKARQLYYNEFPSSKVIGKIDYLAWLHMVGQNYIIVQNASERLSTSVRPQDEPLAVHETAAYLHLRYFIEVSYNRKRMNDRKANHADS